MWAVQNAPQGAVWSEPEFIDETTIVSQDLSSEVGDDSQAAHGTTPKAATKDQTKPMLIFRASQKNSLDLIGSGTKIFK